MANRQIHELDPVSTLTTSDRIVVSTAAGNLTRRASLAALPFVSARPGGTARTLAAKLNDSVSVKDFGAEGDDVADDAAAFNAAMASGARTIRIPQGRYRLSAPVVVPAHTNLIGDGRDQTVLVATHDGVALDYGTVFVFQSTEYIDGTLSGVGISTPPTSTAAALRVGGNNFVGIGLRFFGSGPNGWAIEMDHTNEGSLEDILAWGDGAEAWRGNGIWFRNSGSLPVNYGDSSIRQVGIKLANNNLKGMFFEGANAAPGIINNIIIEKVNITAPGQTGCLGIHIKNARRLMFVSVDLESMTTGVLEEGTGNNMTEINSYLGVFFLSNGVVPHDAYLDSNDAIPGSVKNRTFLGCDNFPALGAAFVDNDSMLARNCWFASPSTGKPTLRLSEGGGVLRVDRGADPFISFGAPATGNNSRITCGVDGLTAPYDATLYMGDLNIRKVTVEPVLHMNERTTAPPMTTDGMLAIADGNPVAGGWNPSHDRGWYIRHGGAWNRLVDTRMKGWVAVNEQTGTSYTLQPADVGDRVAMSGASAKTVTVPQLATVPGSSGAKAPGVTTVISGRQIQCEVTIEQVGSGTVTLAAGSGVTITGPVATSADGQALVVRWTTPTLVRTRLA